MRFERESWRKLYVSESPEHQLMSVFARGLRDYLLRFAKDDGVILAGSTDVIRDLCKLLRAEQPERRQVSKAVEELSRVGYLVMTKSSCKIPKFKEAQEARSPNAERQRRFKERQRSELGDSPKTPTGNVTPPLPVTVQGNALEALQIDETRRDETRSPKPPATDLQTRAEALDRDWSMAAFEKPQDWPETRLVLDAYRETTGQHGAKFAAQDTGVRAVIRLFAAGYTPGEVVELLPSVLTSEWWRTAQRGLSSLTPEVIRRAGSVPTVNAGREVVDL